jgi:hypothetical protein
MKRVPEENASVESALQPLARAPQRAINCGDRFLEEAAKRIQPLLAPDDPIN